MAKPRKTLKQSKVKKKRWYKINSPKLMGEKLIGESYLSDINEALGRKVTVNLMQLTGDMKSQSASVKFEISGIQDNTLITKICGYKFSPATIKRFVRRRMTRIDVSLIATTKDNITVKIKPFLLTREKISRSVEYAMRAKLTEEITEFVKKTPYEELFSAVIKHRLQKELKTNLNKIYPIKNIQIRVLEKVLDESKKVVKPELKEVVEEVKEEKPVEEKKEEEPKEEISETKVSDDAQKPKKVSDKPKKKKVTKKKAKPKKEKKPAKKTAAKKPAKKTSKTLKK